MAMRIETEYDPLHHHGDIMSDFLVDKEATTSSLACRHQLARNRTETASHMQWRRIFMVANAQT